MSIHQRPSREDIINVLRNNADDETMNTIREKFCLSKDDMTQPRSELGNKSITNYIEAVFKIFREKRMLMEELRTSEEFIHSIREGEYSAYMNRVESNANDLLRDAHALELSPCDFQLSLAIACKRDILRYSSPKTNPRKKKIDELEAEEVTISKTIQIFQRDHETYTEAFDMCLSHLDSSNIQPTGPDLKVLLRDLGETFGNGNRKTSLATLHKLEGVNPIGSIPSLKKDDLKILRQIRTSPEKKDEALGEVATRLFQKWKLISSHQRDLEIIKGKEKKKRQLDRERDALEWKFQKEARALQEERTRLERAITENEYLYERKKGQLRACLDAALLNLLDDKERSDAVINDPHVAKKYLC